METERTVTDVFNNPQPGDWAQFRYPNEHICIHVVTVLEDGQLITTGRNGGFVRRSIGGWRLLGSPFYHPATRETRLWAERMVASGACFVKDKG